MRYLSVIGLLSNTAMHPGRHDFCSVCYDGSHSEKGTKLPVTSRELYTAIDVKAGLEQTQRPSDTNPKNEPVEINGAIARTTKAIPCKHIELGIAEGCVG